MINVKGKHWICEEYRWQSGDNLPGALY
jgi:hypothetical protein